jgi:hypothetical protein
MSVDSAILSAITALVAVVVGPIVAVTVAKKQINATVVSGNRQVWINRLRDEVASLVAIVHYLPSAHANKSMTSEAAIEKYGQFVERAQVVKLLINPKERDHRELVHLVDTASRKLINSINSKQANAPEFEALAEEIVTHTQAVLKREWNRVKNGK